MPKIESYLFNITWWLLTDWSLIYHTVQIQPDSDNNTMLHAMTLSQTDHQPMSTAEHAPTQPVDISELQVATVCKQQLTSQAAASDDSDDDVH